MESIQYDDISIERDLSFHSKSDNLVIYYDIYMPKDKKNSLLHPNLYAKQPTIVQIAHGMIEHKGRYFWLCSHLAFYGYIVAISDHRGHGKSIDPAHTWGEMGGVNIKTDKNGFHKAIDDLYVLTQILCERFPKHHLILLGHSMGSLLARGYLKIHGEVLSGLILSGSPAYNPLLRLGIAMASFLRYFGIREYGKKMINGLLFGGFNKPFVKKGSSAQYSTGKFAWLSRDIDSVKAYCSDEACQFIFSLDSFIALFEGTLWVQEPLCETSTLTNEALPKPPIYMISGASDSCGDFGRGVEKIAWLLRDYGFDVTLKLYKGARHEIFQEINRQEVLLNVLEWIHNIANIKNVQP